MSAAALPYFRLYELPWSPGAESEERFRKILRNCFIAYLVFGVLIPLLPVPERDLTRAPEIPDRVVQLIVEQPKPVPLWNDEEYAESFSSLEEIFASQEDVREARQKLPQQRNRTPSHRTDET